MNECVARETRKGVILLTFILSLCFSGIYSARQSHIKIFNSFVIRAHLFSKKICLLYGSSLHACAETELSKYKRQKVGV